MTNSLSVSQSISLYFLLQPHIHFPFLSAATQTIKKRMTRYRNKRSRHISSFLFSNLFSFFFLSRQATVLCKKPATTRVCDTGKGKSGKKYQGKNMVSYGASLQGGQQKKPHATHTVRHRASRLFPILFYTMFCFPAFPWIDRCDQRFCYFRDQGRWKLTHVNYSYSTVAGGFGV